MKAFDRNPWEAEEENYDDDDGSTKKILRT